MKSIHPITVVCIRVSHPGRLCPIGPKGSKRAPGGTAPGGRIPGMPLDGSKPERGYPDLKGSTIIPPCPGDLRRQRESVFYIASNFRLF